MFGSTIKETAIKRLELVENEKSNGTGMDIVNGKRGKLEENLGKEK